MNLNTSQTPNPLLVQRLLDHTALTLDPREYHVAASARREHNRLDATVIGWEDGGPGIVLRVEDDHWWDFAADGWETRSRPPTYATLADCGLLELIDPREAELMSPTTVVEKVVLRSALIDHIYTLVDLEERKFNEEVAAERAMAVMAFYKDAVGAFQVFRRGDANEYTLYFYREGEAGNALQTAKLQLGRDCRMDHLSTAGLERLLLAWQREKVADAYRRRRTADRVTLFWYGD